MTNGECPMTNEMTRTGMAEKSFVAAVVVIAATYGYFLIFAEFAFLELLRASVGEAGLRVAMGALGVGGVVGSVLAAWRFRAATYPRVLAWSSLACAGAAGAACVSASAWTAAVIGLALGWLTVTLASGLRVAVGVKRLGLAVGLGTGLAYAACNFPVVFTASARAQTGVSIVFILVAVGATRWLRVGTAAEVSTSGDFKPKRVGTWTLVFLALVWMDSAAFYIIQHTPSLRAGTWGQSGSLWLNAGMHLGVAVLAGVGMDRDWWGRVVFGAWVALSVACVLLSGEVRGFVGAEMLYTAGVSLYSVALVYYPARGGRAWVAGVVFAVAGWLGSAWGIGMAQDLHVVPVWFVGAAGVVVTGVLLARRRERHGLRQPLLVGVGLIGLGSLVLSATPGRAGEVDNPAAVQEVLRGREVFIGEGCIHCHSQYVRPGTLDVTRWGPEKSLATSLAETPPLFGNRRQGPDLTQVGNRRSPEWNRLHLIAPRVISPGSRMPSYAHLFREGDGRGEALVAYLASLGAETVDERVAQVTVWKPSTPSAGGAAEVANGARLFAQLCVNCHGASGCGDGVMAERLSVRPPDWTRDAWRRVNADALDESLARVIKFGLPASPMAGHEYLRDDEVVSLARYVRSLHVGPTFP